MFFSLDILIFKNIITYFKAKSILKQIKCLYVDIISIKE